MACVTAIGTISKATVEVPLFISGVREARKDMEAVLRELTSLTLCLSMIRDDAEKVTFPAALLAVVQSCDEIANEIVRLMDNLRLKKTGRIRWNLTERDQVNKLRSSLESHKSCIDVALDMASIQLLAAVKEDTNEIKAQTTAIKADTEDIKQDTQQISGLVEEIALLRLQVSQLKQENGSAGVTLQRFLDETSSYAESVIDATELDQFDPDGKDNLSVIYSVDCSDNEGDERKREESRGVNEQERPTDPSSASGYWGRHERPTDPYTTAYEYWRNYQPSVTHPNSHDSISSVFETPISRLPLSGDILDEQQMGSARSPASNSYAGVRIAPQVTFLDEPVIVEGENSSKTTRAGARVLHHHTPSKATKDLPAALSPRPRRDEVDPSTRSLVTEWRNALSQPKSPSSELAPNKPRLPRSSSQREKKKKSGLYEWMYPQRTSPTSRPDKKR